MSSLPFISVVTPVYNMAAFLPECIESVLGQTHSNFEYIIVDNCSTDGSSEVAQVYARRDPRVRVHRNEQFVGVIENHNIAFSRISPLSNYCKVVSADDYIFPDCLRLLIECAEANPSVGIVGSYQLNGTNVLWQGFPYPKAVIPGREMCRAIFLGEDKTFGFGTPTSLLYRADIVRNREAFFPDRSPHADTSACFKELRNCDFGFVYQVLSYQRVHGQSESAKSEEMNRYTSAYLNDLLRYGPVYLTGQEYERKLRSVLKDYYEYLAVNLFKTRGRTFWDYHKSRLEELGFPVTSVKLVKALLTKGLKEFKSPRRVLRKVFHNL